MLCVLRVLGGSFSEQLTELAEKYSAWEHMGGLLTVD